LASRFPSELGVRGTKRLPNCKEELAQIECTLVADLVFEESAKRESQPVKTEHYCRYEKGKNLQWTKMKTPSIYAAQPAGLRQGSNVR
jgi:hypothetical protein